MRIIMLITSVILLNGCAAVMTDNAAKVHVHSQMSTLLDGCKKLGPLSAKSTGFMFPHELIMQAKINVREQAAAMGADTVVVTNVDLIGDKEATAQAVALRCY